MDMKQFSRPSRHSSTSQNIVPTRPGGYGRSQDFIPNKAARRPPDRLKWKKRLPDVAQIHGSRAARFCGCRLRRKGAVDFLTVFPSRRKAHPHWKTINQTADGPPGRFWQHKIKPLAPCPKHQIDGRRPSSTVTIHGRCLALAPVPLADAAGRCSSLPAILETA